jgi:uncharacterized membrane protein YagU involved in acid resistance
MAGKLIRRDIAIGCIAGIVATLVTGPVRVLLGRLTPAAERAKEPPIPEGTSSGSAARMLLETLGQDPHQQAIRRTRAVLHYGLGAAWGPFYCVARRRGGMTPLLAGATAGASLSLVVDEIVNSVLGTTPPSAAFPLSAHLRGLATHLVWGAAAAVTAEMLYRGLNDSIATEAARKRRR